MDINTISPQLLWPLLSAIPAVLVVLVGLVVSIAARPRIGGRSATLAAVGFALNLLTLVSGFILAVALPEIVRSLGSDFYTITGLIYVVMNLVGATGILLIALAFLFVRPQRAPDPTGFTVPPSGAAPPGYPPPGHPPSRPGPSGSGPSGSPSSG